MKLESDFKQTLLCMPHGDATKNHFCYKTKVTYLETFNHIFFTNRNPFLITENPNPDRSKNMIGCFDIWTFIRQSET